MRATSPRDYAPVCRSNLWLLSFVARVLMCAAELVQIAAMSEQMITFESLTQDARKTQEVPPRVSVYDVIAAAKGCDGNVAGMMFRRMVQAGTVPECDEVPSILVLSSRLIQDSHGGQRKSVLVATAHEMVQVLWALPGTNDFRKHCADVVVRYLGGDPTLVEEVFQNREAQEQLASTVPAHPARIFGEAVEAVVPSEYETMRKRLLDDVRNVVREETQHHHVWSFSKRSRNHRELMDVGRIVHGAALCELDRLEGIVRIVDFMQDRIEPSAWALHGRKFKSIFACELKRKKLHEAAEEGLPPPVTFNQGEHRIVYTRADTELMVQTLSACRARFEAIARRDAPLIVRPRGSQRSISEFMRPRAGTESPSDAESEE